MSCTGGDVMDTSRSLHGHVPVMVTDTVTVTDTDRITRSLQRQQRISKGRACKEVHTKENGDAIC